MANLAVVNQTTVHQTGVNQSASEPENIQQLSVRELAQTGDFRAIAFWLNSCLVPQGIYVRVGAAQPGRLLVLVEFEQMPDRDRLTRFICHRLCKLNSSLIQGVQIEARWVDSSPLLWQHSVRLTRPTPRQPRRSHALPPQTRSLPQKSVIQKLRSNPQPVKQPRALLLGGSAVAAFLVGCGFEALSHYATALTSSQSEADVAGLSGDRPHTVQAALEEIPVIQHSAGLNPTDPTVTLTFSGDATLGSVPVQSQDLGAQNSTGDLTGIEAYQKVDLALTNLDDPILNRPFGSDESSTKSLKALTAASVDVVNLASNQMMQNGSTELMQTLDRLEQSGMYPIGAGRNQREARRPEVIDVKGQRIAYLGYSDSDLSAASSWTPGVNYAPIDEVAEDIQAIRSQVDWVIVNYHWNQDLAEYPANWQMNLARFAIDKGADLVVGNHPDVLQGAEIYKGRAIAYSLGNFIFNDSAPPQGDYDTAVLKVSLGKGQMRLEFLPVQVRQSKPEIVSGEKAEAILQYLQQASGLFEEPMQNPTVLDSRPQSNGPEAFSKPSAPSTSTEPIEPTEPIQSTEVPSATPSATPSDSFVTYPDSPTPKEQATPEESQTPPDVRPQAVSTPTDSTPIDSDSAVDPVIEPVSLVTPPASTTLAAANLSAVKPQVVLKKAKLKP